MQSSVIAYAGIASVAIHFMMRILKSGQFDLALLRLGLPSIPDKAIPWIALALGLGGGIADALVQHMGWGDAIQASVLGLLSGSGAVALHETAVKSLQVEPPIETPKLDSPK